MYFSKQLTELPKSISITPKKIADDFRKRLEDGKDRILFRISDEGKKITYATNDELGFFSFAINYKHSIVDCIKPDSFSDTDILTIFISFVMDADEKMDEQQQIDLYGDYYHQSKILADLNEEEVTQYYKDKADLSRFLTTLDQTDELFDQESSNYTFDFSLFLTDTT